MEDQDILRALQLTLLASSAPEPPADYVSDDLPGKQYWPNENDYRVMGLTDEQIRDVNSWKKDPVYDLLPELDVAQKAWEAYWAANREYAVANYLHYITGWRAAYATAMLKALESANAS